MNARKAETKAWAHKHQTQSQELHSSPYHLNSVIKFASCQCVIRFGFSRLSKIKRDKIIRVQENLHANKNVCSNNTPVVLYLAHVSLTAFSIYSTDDRCFCMWRNFIRERSDSFFFRCSFCSGEWWCSCCEQIKPNNLRHTCIASQRQHSTWSGQTISENSDQVENLIWESHQQIRTFSIVWSLDIWSASVDRKKETGKQCNLLFAAFSIPFFVCAVFAFVRGFHFNQYNNFYYDFDSQFSE